MVTRLSNQKVQYNTMLVFFSVVIIYFMLAVLQTSLACVDANGCLLEHCQEVNFKQEYKELLDAQRNNNAEQCIFARK